MKGVWRLLTVRYSKRTKQMMVMLCVSLKAVDTSVWTGEMEKFTTFIRSIQRTETIDCEDISLCFDEESKNTDENNSLVTALCYQVYDGLSVPSSDHEVISIYGEVFKKYLVIIFLDRSYACGGFYLSRN